MGSILSQNSTPKLKGEDSSLIEIQEIHENELSRETQVKKIITLFGLDFI